MQKCLMKWWTQTTEQATFKQKANWENNLKVTFEFSKLSKLYRLISCKKITKMYALLTLQKIQKKKKKSISQTFITLSFIEKTNPWNKKMANIRLDKYIITMNQPFKMLKKLKCYRNIIP